MGFSYDDKELHVPDSIEPIIGWKALLAHRLANGEWTLLSPQQRMRWPQRQRAEATCEREHEFKWQPTRGLPNEAPDEASTYFYGNRLTFSQVVAKPRVELPDGYVWSWEKTPHEVASSGCGCGIYMVDTAEQCVPYLAPHSVVCTIAMWGRVITGTHGARGQYAYPQSIEYASGFSSEALVELAEQYGLTLPEETPQTSKLSQAWANAQNTTQTFTLAMNSVQVSLAEPETTSKRRFIPTKLSGLVIVGLLAAGVFLSKDPVVTVLLTIAALLVAFGTPLAARNK